MVQIIIGVVVVVVVIATSGPYAFLRYLPQRPDKVGNINMILQIDKKTFRC